MSKTYIALDISTAKIGVAIFKDFQCVQCKLIKFDPAETLEIKAMRFKEQITSFLLDNCNGAIDAVAYEAPLMFIKGKSSANVVTKLAAFNLMCRWIVWTLVGCPELIAVPVQTYKAYFNRTVFTAEELQDNTIKNLSESKLYNLAVAKRLFKQHVPHETVLAILEGKNRNGGAAQGVDDVADAIVVGFYCALHRGKPVENDDAAGKQLKRSRTKGPRRPIRRTRRLANR